MSSPLDYVGPLPSNPNDVIAAPEAVTLMTAPGIVTAAQVANQLADMQTPDSYSAQANPLPPPGMSVYATTAYMESYLIPSPPQKSDQTALTSQQITVGVVGTLGSSSLIGDYKGVAELESASPYPLLSPAIFPVGGQGFLMGSWGPTNLGNPVTYPLSCSQPVNVANWVLGPQDIDNWLPLVFASVSVSSIMAYPVLYMTMCNESTTADVPPFESANVIGMGQGRRFFDDAQSVLLWPSSPQNAVTGNPSTYSVYGSLWVANLLGTSPGSQITGVTIDTAGLYLWQSAGS